MHLCYILVSKNAKTILCKILCMPVLWIRDHWLTFRQRPARCQQKIIFSSKFLWLLLFLGTSTFTSFSKDKSHKKVTKEYKSRFFFLFLFEDGRMRIRIRKNNDGSGPWKNIGILRIRVRNTACLRYQKITECTLACDRIIFWSFPHSAVKTVWISWLSARPAPYGDRPPHHSTPPHRPSPHSRSRSHCSSLRNHSPPHSQSFSFLGARLSTSPKRISSYNSYKGTAWPNWKGLD